MPDVQEVFRMATQKVRPDPGSLERQVGRQRKRSVRRKVGVYALVALLAIAGAVIGVGLLRGDDPAGVPASEREQDAITVEGGTPTAEGLAGFWLEDVSKREGDAFEARAGSKSEYSFDPTISWYTPDGGLRHSWGQDFESEPWCSGTYLLVGDHVTWNCGVVRFTTRAGLTEDGWLHDVVVETGTGEAPTGTRRAWARVFPGSPAGATLVGPAALTLQTYLLENPSELSGFWVEEDGDLLLHIASSGTYEIHDASGLGVDPYDVGTVEVAHGTITFTSGSDSRTCAEGNRIVWAVERGTGVLPPGVRGALRAVVERDDCTGRADADWTWFRLTTA